MSAFINVASTSLRLWEYETEITRPQNQLSAVQEQYKISAPFFKELPLTSTLLSWLWMAPSTTLTLWILVRSWVLIHKEWRSLPPSSMCIPTTTPLNLSIPDVPSPVPLPKQIRRFQAKSTIHLIHIDLSLLLCSGGVLRTRYLSASFSFTTMGSVFSLPALHLSFTLIHFFKTSSSLTTAVALKA